MSSGNVSSLMSYKLGNNNICLRCLNKGHYAKVCGRADLLCQVKGCGKNHHTILHGVNPFDAFHTPNTELKKPVLDGKSTDRRETKSNPPPNLASTTTAATGAGETRISLGVIPIQLQIEDSTFIKTYALLDTGSEVSLLSQKVADRLGYSGVKNAFTITRMTGSAQIDSEMFNITIKSLDGRSVHSLNSVKSVHFMSVNKGCIPGSVDIQRWSHLRDIYYEHVKLREIGLLIGLNELPKLFVPLESRSGGDDEPIAVRYPLGWMILGRLGREKIDSDYSVNFIQVTDVSDQDRSMRYQLDRLWNHEFKDLEVDNKVCLSVDDKLALELVENSLKLEDGVFVVPMPWKHQPPELPNNKQLASKRLEGLKKRFIRDPELYLKYRETIQDYVQNGHAEIVPSEDLSAKKSQPLWYLPHHPVIHPLKETVRVVFDCAASFRGTSLNQQLHQGPDLTNPLVGVLMRFRGGSIGVVADIKAMFHQVRVAKQDCDALRFLWWKDDDFTDQVQEYRMVKHIFRAKSSPFIANHCLRTTAKMV
ncbi:hypothetical protein SNE40_019845 [Patella caerulea]|uniref:Uncharacterized protein n=1 Tax=Patella caerulea TaxID=87958 RepID=A0AAN8G695_PATCE